MKYAWACIFALVWTVLSGCSDKSSLGGKVTFSDDGTPVTKGIITFTSDKLQSQGMIKPDGTYVVGTLKMDDGIPPGTYRVTVGGADDVVFAERPDGGGGTVRTEIRTPLIDAKYQSPDTSGLSLTVDGKTGKFDIKLDRAAKK